MYPELKGFEDFKVGMLVEDTRTGHRSGLGIVLANLNSTDHPKCLQIKWSNIQDPITYSVWNEEQIYELKIIK